MDLLEIQKKGHFVADYDSKWPEVAFLTKTDAGTVIKCLESMFHTHGLPDMAEGDLILLRQNRENKLSPTLEPEPYRVLEKIGNAVVIENSAGQSKMRNAGHRKKFVDPGTEKGATETELPAPSVKTDTTKEGVTFEQDPVGGIQENSQTQSVPLPLRPAQEGPRKRPVRKRETPKWMKDFVCQLWLNS